MERATALRPSLLLALALLLSVVALLAAAPIACTDFFWHLTLGEIILADRAIPRTDLFSAVHPDAPYVQPQWLWELGAAAIQNAGGLFAVRLAQAFVLVASFALLAWVVRKLLRSDALTLLVGAVALLTFVDRFRARPDALSLGFVAASLPFLLTPEVGVLRTRALGMFALSLVWGNVHGGATLLLVLSLGALGFGALVRTRAGVARPDEIKRWAALSGAALAGLALSPTLIPGLVHWFSLIGPQIDTGNEEWLPTYTILRHGVTPVTLAIAVAPTVVAVLFVMAQVRFVRAGGRLVERAGELALGAGYMVLSHHAIRNVYLCIVPLVLVLRDAAPWFEARARTGVVAFAALGVVALVAHDVVDSGFGGVAHARAAFHDDLMAGEYPEDAGDFLHDAEIEGGIFNEGSWGGYLIWRTYPRAHVFVDTRQNLTPEMWRVFLATRSAAQRAEALEFAFRRWGVELAVFRAPTFATLTPPPAWQLLYRAGDQEVYQRRGGVHEAANLARAARYLRAHGATTTVLAQAAVEVGARRWLDRPAQRETRRTAEAQIAAQDAATRARGYADLATLNYRAGLYAAARDAFSRSAALAPLDVRSTYFAALSAHGAGDTAGARAWLTRITPQSAEALTPRQRERLLALRALVGL